MKHAPRLTAALVVLDEAARLATLLPALGWADEILVVDGGSRDDTLDVARRHGCRVIQRPFDNFAAQRNVAIESASCDWIFSIDADERPMPRLPREVRDRIQRSRPVAYRVPIRSRIFGRRLRFSGTQDDVPVRLFRASGARWHGAVHEVLHVDGRVGRLRHGLEHDTLPDLEAFLVKMNRYTTLASDARLARGVLPRRFDRWVQPPLEVLRRLVWKQGMWDGPEGWSFCALSGLSAWVLCDKHHRRWRAAQSQRLPLVPPSPSNDGVTDEAVVNHPWRRRRWLAAHS